MQKIVKMGDVVLANPGDTLSIYGLGSCIALVLYDPVNKIGCMLHVLLPDSNGSSSSFDTRYADDGFKEMLNYLNYAGSKSTNLFAKMAGGTRNKLSKDYFNDIGKRNELSCKRLLSENNICLVSEDCGGFKSRSVFFSVPDMKFTIKSDNKDLRVI